LIVADDTTGAVEVVLVADVSVTVVVFNVDVLIVEVLVGLVVVFFVVVFLLVVVAAASAVARANKTATLLWKRLKRILTDEVTCTKRTEYTDCRRMK
jgi:hypothetical protein